MNYPLPDDCDVVSTNHSMSKPSRDDGTVVPNKPLHDNGIVIPTKGTDAVSDSSPLFGLDCEMVSDQKIYFHSSQSSFSSPDLPPPPLTLPTVLHIHCLQLLSTTFYKRPLSLHLYTQFSHILLSLVLLSC